MGFNIEKCAMLIMKSGNREIMVQNNAIRTNYVKMKIDKMLQTSKCRLCGEIHETVNHIIRGSSKLAQKEYKTKYDRVGKVIH